MTIRLTFAVFVLIGATAFAPAPFPKTPRDRQLDGLSLNHLQGTWAVEKLLTSRSNGRHTDAGTYLKEIQIAGDRWTFVYREAKSSSVCYSIGVDPKVKPPQLNFYHASWKQGQPYGVGILKRQGDVVTLMYNWSTTRAVSFDSPPDGHWVLVMQRAR